MPENQPGEGLGHFFGAMRMDAFRPIDEAKAHMDNWIQRFRSAKPVAGAERVIIPGEPERAMEAERRTTGIPLLQPVVQDLQQLTAKFQVAMPPSLNH
jgi:LDH2 family malate/lactate/ureidoglycolate dehydrogenase